MVIIQRSLDQSVQRTLRLILVGMGVVALSAFLAAFGYGHFLVERLNTVYLDRVVPLHDLQRIGHQINVHIPRRYWGGTYEPARAGDADSPLESDWAVVEVIWSRYLTTYLTPEEEVLAARVRSGLDEVRHYLLPEGGVPNGHLAFGRHVLGYTDAVLRLNSELGALNELQVSVALENLQRAQAASRRATVLGLVLLGLVLMLLFIAHRVVSRRVIAPIGWVSQALQRLAQGDVRPQRADRSQHDEFAELFDQIQRLRHFVAERQRLLQEERLISEQLRNTQAELVEADKLASLGALVAGVSHELNTPLGVAVTVASSLEQKRLAFVGALGGAGLRRSTLDGFVTDVQQATELLQNNLERAVTLVRSFKQVAVDRTGMVRRRFDLHQTVDEVMASLRPGLRTSGIELVNQVPPDLWLEGYPGALGQVLGNLMNNAVLHAFPPGHHPPDGAPPRVWVGVEPPGGDPLDLWVGDNGAGMAPQTLARVFEPFFSTRLGQGGSGLGMSIVRNIVMGVLGGRVQVESSPGCGTVVRMNIPRVAPEQATPTPQETTIYAVE